MTEDWGPWKTHDGKGCPVGNNVLVQIQIRGQWIGEPVGDPHCDRAGVWIWHHDGEHDDIIRYRVRIYRNFQLLQRLAEEPEREGVDA